MPKGMLAGILAGLAAGALWGLVFVAPRMVGGWSAVDLASGRFVVYGALSLGLVLWPLARGRALRLPTPAQARSALVFSVLGFSGYYLFLVLAIRDAGTELPSLIIGTIPLWMLLLGKPAGLRWQALAPALALTAGGLALMALATSAGVPLTAPVTAPTLAPAAASALGAQWWRGVAWACAAMVCWTAFGLRNAAWLQKHPEVDATTWASWLGVASGCGALVLYFFWGSDLKVLNASANRHFAAMVCVATGVGSAWLATILWNIASQRLSASLCGQLIVSETIFALALSFAWDVRWPSGLQLLAVALFVAGIMASIRAHR